MFLEGSAIGCGVDGKPGSGAMLISVLSLGVYSFENSRMMAGTEDGGSSPISVATRVTMSAGVKSYTTFKMARLGEDERQGGGRQRSDGGVEEGQRQSIAVSKVAMGRNAAAQLLTYQWTCNLQAARKHQRYVASLPLIFQLPPWSDPFPQPPAPLIRWALPIHWR